MLSVPAGEEMVVLQSAAARDWPVQSWADCTGTVVVGRNSGRHTMAKMRACVQLFGMLR